MISFPHSGMLEGRGMVNQLRGSGQNCFSRDCVRAVHRGENQAHNTAVDIQWSGRKKLIGRTTRQMGSM